MKRVLLAWEGGAGRGHLVKLARVARALGPRAQCDAALASMDHARELEPHCKLVFQGTRMVVDLTPRRARKAPGMATWADYLDGCGFAEPQELHDTVRWWLSMIRMRRIDLVVADYGPHALIAARIAGIPAIAIGTGYGIPPQDLASFPVLLPEHDQREADEPAMVEAINSALAPLGFAPIDRLAEVYARSGELVASPPMLDPFAASRTPADWMPPVAEALPNAAATGDALFFYCSGAEAETDGLIWALENSGLPLLCVVPNASEATCRRLAEAGADVQRQPLPVADIAARARMVVNTGAHGTLCLAMGLGLPQVCLPPNLECLFHARRAELAGVARVGEIAGAEPEAIRDLLLDAWEDAALAARARDMASELADRFVGDDAADLGAKVARWL